MGNDLVSRNKKLVWEFWQQLNLSRPEDTTEICRFFLAPNIGWHGSHPINDLKDVDEVVDGFWRPFRQAFPDVTRGCDLLIGGHEHWVGGIGYFEGTFTQPWLGIPPTGRSTHIKYGEFSAVCEGKIVLTYLILDILDVLRQAGYHLVQPSRGREGIVPGPATGDGVFFEPQDEAEGVKTLRTAKVMCSYLNRPECRPYWTEDMKWYGPSGIGTTVGYDDFEAGHQAPFNHAFPGYGGTFGVHVVDVGEGMFAGWVGWPSIRATHSGAFLGVPPTGNVVECRLMDFYRREGELIAENWVPIDMLHVFKCMGVDVLAKLGDEVARRAAAVAQPG